MFAAGMGSSHRSVTLFITAYLVKLWAWTLHALGTCWTLTSWNHLLYFWISEITQNISVLLPFFLLTKSATSLQSISTVLMFWPLLPLSCRWNLKWLLPALFANVTWRRMPFLLNSSSLFVNVCLSCEPYSLISFYNSFSFPSKQILLYCSSRCWTNSAVSKLGTKASMDSLYRTQLIL